MLTELAKQLQMNELELTYWALVLEKYKWTDPQINIQELLRVTAFQIKVLFAL